MAGENDATICAENELEKVVQREVEPAGVLGQLLSPICSVRFTPVRSVVQAIAVWFTPERNIHTVQQLSTVVVTEVL